MKTKRTALLLYACAVTLALLCIACAEDSDDDNNSDTPIPCSDDSDCPSGYICGPWDECFLIVYDGDITDADTDSEADNDQEVEADRDAPYILVPELLDYGYVETGDPRPKALYVKNAGYAPLEITGISIIEDADGYFSIEDPPTGIVVVQPEELIEFDILLFIRDVTSGGGAKVQIESNDPETPVVTVDLRFASCRRPDMKVTPRSVVFSDASVGGDAVSLNIVIANPSPTAYCVVDVIIDSIRLQSGSADHFELTGLPQSWPVNVPEGQSMSFDMLFHPQQSGLLEDVLLIDCQNTFDYQIPVNGTGVTR